MIGMKSRIVKLLHLRGVKRIWCLYLVNHIYAGTRNFERKRRLLNSIGCSIGKNTKVVAPIEVSGTFIVGENCWVGKNLKVNGNGIVKIGDNCDIAPEVTFQTGGHTIGAPERRAGEGLVFSQSVGDGTWIGGRVTILGNTNVGASCVVAGCSCVIHDIEDNSLVGGVSAKLIRKLDDDTEN